MNNVDVQHERDRCGHDIDRVKKFVKELGGTSSMVPYLTKYALIRACGTIEVSFKAIVADHCSHNSTSQIKHFLDKYVRMGAANPSYRNIQRLLDDFDPNWKEKFTEKINGEYNKDQLFEALKFLVDARNSFAHGRDTTVSIENVTSYFLMQEQFFRLWMVL